MTRKLSSVAAIGCAALVAAWCPWLAYAQGPSAEDQARLFEAGGMRRQAFEYYRAGRFAEAAALGEEVVNVYQKLLGEGYPQYVTSLNDLGVFYQAMGDFERAASLHLKAIEIHKRVYGAMDREYSVSLNNLALLYRAMGDYARAEPLYRQSLASTKEVFGEKHPNYAQSLNNLAGLYIAMGDCARAEPFYLQALQIRRQILGERHPDYAASVNNLAVLYDTMRDDARAEPLYLEALEIRKNELGEHHPDYAQSLDSIATLYKSRGDFAQAEPLYRQALDIRREILGEKHPQYAESLDSLALLYCQRGDFTRAEPLLEEALQIRKEVLGDQHPDYADSLHSLALLYSSRGDLSRAEPLYRQALEIMVKLVDATAAAQDETGQLRMGQRVQLFHSAYLSCLVGRADKAVEAYAAVLRWKGSTLVRQRAIRLAAESEELAPVADELQAVVRQWSVLAAGAAGNDEASKAPLGELTRRKEQLEVELSRRSAAFRAATSPPTVDELQRALPENAALVDYFEYWLSTPSPARPGQFDWRRSFVAFVVRADGDVQMFDLGEAAPIETAIDAWRTVYGRGPSGTAAGGLLREKVWAPVAEAIGDAELALISPDGSLGKLPFAALPGAKAGSYLLEDMALTLVPAPQLIPALVADAAPKELPKDMLALGGVEYNRATEDESTKLSADVPQAPLAPWARRRGAALQELALTKGLRWRPLPGTGSEAAFVAGLYQQYMGLPAGTERVALLSGSEATEEAVRKLAPQCYVLHLATHGFFAAEDATAGVGGRDDAVEGPADALSKRRASLRSYSQGLLSALVLASANDPPSLSDDPAEFARVPDDGYLTADEISSMRLSSAQLVVLSACESGLGETAGGEGLLGIQRAFQVAGARTTIATLWEVNDEVTRRIMEEFYRNYLDGKMTAQQALRAAQLWALDNPELVGRGVAPPEDAAGDGRLPPRYWAAFTVSGDWR